MNKILYFLISGILFFSISSCCTKMACSDLQNQPSIYLDFIGFASYNELDNTTAYMYSNANNALSDSSDSNYPTSFDAHNNSNLLENFYGHPILYEFGFIQDLKDNYIVIRTPVSFDTIYNFDFTTSTDKVKCNTCFLASDKQDRTEIQNFSYYHKGIQYFDGHTVNIIK